MTRSALLLLTLSVPTAARALRTAPDGSAWMAIAVPAEPGKSGKRYFVVNQDETVYASETKLELDDSCAIPKGAKPLD